MTLAAGTRLGRGHRVIDIHQFLVGGLLGLLLVSCLHSTGANQPRYEARKWLLGNANPTALASSRFETTAQALRFVDRLVAAGAESVLVTGVLAESWRMKAEGGPYADALIVVLPADDAKRMKLFRLANRESAREGLALQHDEGQHEIVLWWD